jgi:hypothetical protein
VRYSIELARYYRDALFIEPFPEDSDNPYDPYESEYTRHLHDGRKAKELVNEALPS